MWKRYHFSNKEDFDKAVKMFQENKNTTVNDVYKQIEDIESEELYETDSTMSLEDNNGFSTIEFIVENGEKQTIVYQNGE